MKRTRTRLFHGVPLLLVTMLFVSCPEPFTIADLDVLEDSLGPQLTILEPVDGEMYQDLITISGTAIDIDGAGELRQLGDATAIPELTWSVTGTETTGTVEIDEDGAFSFQIPSTEYDEDVTVVLTVIDANRNVTTLARRLVYDSRGPAISIDTPAERSVFGKTVGVTGSVRNSDNTAPTNVVAVSYEITSTAILGDLDFDPVSGAFAFQFDTTGIENDIVLRVEAEDFQGDVTTTIRQLSRDTDGPAISVTSPSNYATYGRTVDITGSISNKTDDTATDLISNLAIEVLNTAIADPNLAFDGGTGAFSFSFDTDGLGGDLIVRLAALDIHGNATTETLILQADELGPQIVIISPTNYSDVTATVDVTGLVQNSPTDAGLDAVDFSTLNYQVLNTAISGVPTYDSGTGAFSFSFPTNGISGDLIVRISAEDVNAYQSTETLSLIADGVGPAISITSPAEYSQFASTIPVVGTVTNGAGDTNVDEVSTLTYTAIGGAQSGSASFSGIDGSFNFDIDATGVSSNIVITLTAVDIHGYTAVQSVVLQNDDTGPYINLSSPVDGYFSTVIQLIGQIQNSPADTALTEVDLDSVRYHIPGTAISGTIPAGSIDASGNFAVDIDASSLSTNIVLEVIALDKNGNETTEPVSLLKPVGGGDIEVSAEMGNASVVFTWTPVPGADNYRIEEFVFGGIQDGVTLDVQEQYTWSGLRNGTFHEFQVIATVPGYETAVSSDVVIAPMSSMTFRPWIVNGDYGSLAVEWPASGTSGARFLLERSVNDGSWETVTVTTARRYTDTEAVKTNTYRYRVTLRNNGLGSLNESYASQAFRPPYFTSEVVVANELGSNTFISVDKYADSLVLSDLGAEMYAYDASNPLAPYLTSTFTDAGSRFHRAGSVAYGYRDNSTTVSVIDLDTMAAGAGFVVPYSGAGLQIIDIYSSGAKLYIAVGDIDDSGSSFGAVYIYDITTPASPSYLDEFAAEPAGILADGTSLFIAEEASGGNGTLLVADVANPASVSITDTGLTHANNNAQRVHMVKSGNYLFVRDNSSGFLAYNISSPASPAVVASGGYTVYSDGDLFIDGNRLYVANAYNGGFLAFDVTAILDGSEDGDGATNGTDPFDYNFALDTDTADVFVESGVMWTAQLGGGITVLDLGSPTSITEVGAVALSGGAGDTNAILADGDRLLALTGTAGNTTADSLHVLDITIPDSPVESTVGTGFTSWPDLRSFGDTVILSSTATIDIGQTPPVVLSSGTNPSGREWKMQLRGELALLGTNVNDGITVVDVSDPLSPVEVSTLLEGGKVAVEIFDDYVVGASDSEVVLVDISDRDSPTLLDSFAASTQIRDVAVVGDYVYVIDGSDVKVLIYDPNAGTLTEEPTYQYSIAGSTPYELLAQGDFLLVRCDDGIDTTLVLLDISDVTSISEATSGTITGLDSDSIEWQGGLVYLGDAAARRIVVAQIE